MEEEPTWIIVDSPEADERLSRVTGGLEPRDKGHLGWLSDPMGRNRVKPMQASKVTMRMQTLLPFGEGASFCPGGNLLINPDFLDVDRQTTGDVTAVPLLLRAHPCVRDRASE